MPLPEALVDGVLVDVDGPLVLLLPSVVHVDELLATSLRQLAGQRPHREAQSQRLLVRPFVDQKLF